MQFLLFSLVGHFCMESVFCMVNTFLGIQNQFHSEIASRFIVPVGDQITALGFFKIDLVL